MDGKSTASSLIFIGYTVENVTFRSNKTEKESWKLNFDINNITKISESKKEMEIELNIELFKGVEDAPFYMNVSINGKFQLEGEDDIERYEANAIAIMYPYLRAIVSTYTSIANVMPVILPAINVNAMLSNKKKDE